METALRSAIARWLASDPVLSERVNAIAEEAPAAASPPAIAIAASASTDWSTKTAMGREVRVALELVGRGDDPAETAALAGRIEQRIATLAPQQAGFRVVVTRFLRSRVERRRRNGRAVLLEFAFKLIATE